MLMPRGQTSIHFPQSMHLSISLERDAISPLRRSRFNFRMLKSISVPALQVAVQPPHERQVLNEGSFSRISLSRRPSNWSKSIVRGDMIWYPKVFISSSVEGTDGHQGQQNGHVPESRRPSWGRCMFRQGRFLPLTTGFYSDGDPGH